MKVSRLRTGIMLIGMGFIFLGNTLGFLDWFIWGDLIKLWPVILIALGVEMIFKNTKLSVLSYLSPLLIALCFVYVVYGGNALADKHISPKKNSSIFIVSDKDGEDLNSLEINMDLAVGNFDVKSSDSDLFYGEIEYYGEEPEFKFSKQGDDGVIKLKYKKSKNVWRKFRKTNCYSKIYLTDKLPIDLDINAGVVDLTLDLSDIILDKLSMDTGVSSLMVRFGDKANDVRADFDIGVSQLSVYVPKNVAVRLHKDTGLTSFSYKELGLEKVGKNLYETPGYDMAEKTLDIYIDAGVSSINIEHYNSKGSEL